MVLAIRELVDSNDTDDTTRCLQSRLVAAVSPPTQLTA
jgi:hypothetical protein